MWLTINVIPMSMKRTNTRKSTNRKKEKTHNDEDSPSLLNYGGPLIFLFEHKTLNHKRVKKYNKDKFIIQKN